MYTVNSIQQWDELERLSITEKPPTHTPPPKCHSSLDLHPCTTAKDSFSMGLTGIITNNVTGEVYHKPITLPTRKFWKPYKETKSAWADKIYKEFYYNN